MLLRFLRYKDHRAVPALLIFALLFMLPPLLKTFGHEHYTTIGILSDLKVFDSAGWIFKLIGCALLAANMILFNKVLVGEEITRQNNQVPAYLLGMYLSFCAAENKLIPQLVAQLFLTLSFQNFIKTWRKDRPSAMVFNASFYLALAIIIFPPYWVFLGLGFIALTVMRTFDWKEYSMIFLGLLLPYYFYLSGLFLAGKNLWEPMDNLKNSFHLPSLPTYFRGSLPVNFFSLALLLFSALFFLTRGSGGKIKTQKALAIFFWSLIPCVAAIFISKNHFVFTGTMAVMQVSLFAGIYISESKHHFFADLLLTLVSLAAIFSSLQHFNIISF